MKYRWIWFFALSAVLPVKGFAEFGPGPIGPGSMSGYSAMQARVSVRVSVQQQHTVHYSGCGHISAAPMMPMMAYGGGAHSYGFAGGFGGYGYEGGGYGFGGGGGGGGRYAYGGGCATRKARGRCGHKHKCQKKCHRGRGFSASIKIKGKGFKVGVKVKGRRSY